MKKKLVIGPQWLSQPIMTDARLPLPSVERFYSQIAILIAVGVDGACFYGESGNGKSTAIVMAAERLRADYRGMPVFVMTTPNKQVTTKKDFAVHWLTASGAPTSNGTAYHMRHTLVSRLVDTARNNASKHIVLLIDEAQNMLRDDFLFLKDVYNDLMAERIHLVTLCVGQSPNILNVHRAFRQDKEYGDIVRRFFSRCAPFDGIRLDTELGVVLGLIESAGGPEGALQTIKHFCPESSALGWRLSHETGNFSVAMAAHGYAPDEVVPAKVVFGVVRDFLFKAAQVECDPNKTLLDLESRDEIWRLAILDACFSKKSVAVVDDDDDGDPIAVQV